MPPRLRAEGSLASAFPSAHALQDAALAPANRRAGSLQQTAFELVLLRLRSETNVRIEVDASTPKRGLDPLPHFGDVSEEISPSFLILDDDPDPDGGVSCPILTNPHGEVLD